MCSNSRGMRSELAITERAASVVLRLVKAIAAVQAAATMGQSVCQAGRQLSCCRTSAGADA